MGWRLEHLRNRATFLPLLAKQPFPWGLASLSNVTHVVSPYNKLSGFCFSKLPSLFYQVTLGSWAFGWGRRGATGTHIFLSLWCLALRKRCLTVRPARSGGRQNAVLVSVRPREAQVSPSGVSPRHSPSLSALPQPRLAQPETRQESLSSSRAESARAGPDCRALSYAPTQSRAGAPSGWERSLSDVRVFSAQPRPPDAQSLEGRRFFPVAAPE